MPAGVLAFHYSRFARIRAASGEADHLLRCVVRRLRVPVLRRAEFLPALVVLRVPARFTVFRVPVFRAVVLRAAACLRVVAAFRAALRAVPCFLRVAAAFLAPVRAVPRFLRVAAPLRAEARRSAAVRPVLGRVPSCRQLVSVMSTS